MSTINNLNNLNQLNELIKTSTSKFYQKCIEHNLFHLAWLVVRKENKQSIQEYSNAGKVEYEASKKNTALNVYEEMLKKFSFLSHSELALIYKNIKEIGLTKYDFYNPIIVNSILERTRKYKVTNTFSITTCKRLNLFTRTMNSFLNCCQDLHLIDRWICVDDNSSEQDRQQMKKLFPFFDFVFKGQEEKGHVSSMNIILNEVKKTNSEYLFHMEDDFLFFVCMPFITLCKNILDHNERIGQCLLNRNYAETCDQWSIHGGQDLVLQNGQRFSIHEHYSDNENTPQKTAFYDTCNKNGYSSCAYWPHFSFRPSLIKVSALLHTGNFRDVSHFEMDYAYRYVQNNYLSSFLHNIVCEHIGKLTFEKDKDNAYSLNNQQQFSRFNIQNQIKKYLLLNMEKRKDRLEIFKRNNDSILHNKNYQLFYCYDGQKLAPSYFLNRMFDYNDYHWRKSMLGCALSHLKLWYELKKLKDDDIYVIFEDDIVIVSNFDERLKELSTVLQKQKIDNWDVIFLGYCLSKVTSRFCDEKEPLKLIKCNTRESFSLSFGGTYGYMITGRGAKKLLNLLNVTGINQGIDTMMQKACDVLNIYYVHPHLVHSVHFAQDSDIQQRQYVQTDFLVPSIQDYLFSMKTHMENNRLKVSVVFEGEYSMNKEGDVILIYNEKEKVKKRNEVDFYFMFDNCACIFKNKQHNLLPLYRNRLPETFDI